MRKYNFYTGCCFNSKWCDGMEKQQRNGTALATLPYSLYCFELNAPCSIRRAACFNIRFWISRVRTTSIEMPNLRRASCSLAILRVCSLSPPASLLPISSPFSPFSTFRSQNHAPLRPLFSRTSNRVLFNWWDAFRCARTYRLAYFFFVSSLYIPLR